MIDVAIVGGGIAGLTLAVRLASDGHAVQVFERAQEIAPVGAGIWMPPNAMAVLDRLGLATEVAAAGAELESAVLLTERGRTIRSFAHWAVPTTHGQPLISMLRSDLHAILLGALPRGVVRSAADARLVASSCGGVVVTFGDGSRAEARLLVGADGIRSTVREHVRPGVRPRPAGGLCWRGLSLHRLAGPWRASAREYWGDGLRFGLSRVPGGVYWFAVLEGAADAIPELVDDVFAHFPAPVPAILEATSATDRVATRLEELPEFYPWHTDRIVVLGDAAHAATPNLGQGAAMAIEDAWALAEAIAHHGLNPAALTEFDARRRPRARRVVRDSRALGHVASLSSPLARRVRDVVLSRIPSRVWSHRVEWLFEPDLDGDHELVVGPSGVRAAPSRRLHGAARYQEGDMSIEVES